ncbi:MAG: biotin transporter BioY [Bacteroidetes bacterium QS_1_63_11]|nr:MAG: biotin transporter BioY [Bacteroidetes bacterium QS_1_63_11]
MSNLLSLRSSHTALVDRLRETQASVLLQAVGVTGFALFTALGAQIQFRVYLWEVPITLQTAVVYASGLYLGWRNGLLAQALYLALGLFLPVFAGDGYGPSYLFGVASAGYLLSYPAAAAVIGALSRRWKAFSGSTLASLAGAALIFTCGVVWLHYAAGHGTWMESIDKGFLRFAVIDLVKVLGVGLLYSGTRYLARSEA